MSMPIICNEAHRQCQDTFMYLLFYGGSDTLLRSLIQTSVNNILSEFPGDNIRDALGPFLSCPQASPHLLRAIFIVLLEKDEKMRVSLCEESHVPGLNKLCVHKACRLYDTLTLNIDDWIKNEEMEILDFVETIKDSYLVS
jgi:hypothetical protein